MKIVKIENNLLKHLISKIRDKNTDSFIFRKYISDISKILLMKFLEDENLVYKEIETWIGRLEQPFLEEDRYVFIPILRAGLPMLDGALEILPNSKAGFLAIKRDEETLESKIYYKRLPDLKNKIAVILDPMVATGGSLSLAIDILKEENPEKIISLNIIAAPEGLERLKTKDFVMYIAQIDEKLNDKGYIIPGIGDAGDRIFNT